jgi:hypothetical protein
MTDELVPLPDEDFPQPTSEHSARDMLRAFEDEHLPEATHIDGEIDKGIGSKHEVMRQKHPDLAAHHAALERLVQAEDEMTRATAALAAAEDKHAAALIAVENHAERDH